MRILLTTDVIGGVWRYTLNLVRELIERGHECAVAVIGQPGDVHLGEVPPGVEVVWRDLRLEWMPGAGADIDVGTDWLVRFAGQWRADLVHLNQYAYAAGDYNVPTLVVSHSDVRSWYDEVRGTHAPAEWDDYARVVSRGLAAASAVVAPTAYQSGRLARHYGWARTRVIPNGMRVPATLPGDRPASQRPLVLVAGRAWDEAKGIDLLDEALDGLGPTAPSVHLVGPVLGPGGERIRVRNLVPHGEVPGDAMASFYANTGVYIAPSIYEPFGLTPLEAAAHGCSLLLSGIGSFRELWTDAAQFFEPGSSADLGVRLMNLVEDAATMDDLAGSARNRARSSYGADRMADRYLELYAQLVSGHEARAATASADSPNEAS